MVELIGGHLRSGDRVAVLGLTFKGGTDDVRASPAMLLALELLDRGAFVVGYDPSCSPEVGAILRVPIARSAVQAAVGASAVVLGADWREFCELDWNAIAAVAPDATIFDCRCVLDSEVVEASGLRYYRPGRGLSVPRESALSHGSRMFRATPNTWTALVRETSDEVLPTKLPLGEPYEANRARRNGARV